MSKCCNEFVFFVIFTGLQQIGRIVKKRSTIGAQKWSIHRFLKSGTLEVRISLLVYFISRVYTFNNQKKLKNVPHLFCTFSSGSGKSDISKKRTTLRFGVLLKVAFSRPNRASERVFSRPILWHKKCTLSGFPLQREISCKQGPRRALFCDTKNDTKVAIIA